MATDGRRGGWDALDRRMVHIAANRGLVLVLMDDDREVEATLVCWRPSGHGPARARVILPGGRARTVPTHLVRPIPTPPT